MHALCFVSHVTKCRFCKRIVFSPIWGMPKPGAALKVFQRCHQANSKKKQIRFFKSPNDVLPRTLHSHRKVAVFLGDPIRYSGKGWSEGPSALLCAGVRATFISHETITK